VNVPRGVDAVVCTFSVEDPGDPTELGVKVTVAFDGCPDTVSVTGPVKPPFEASDTV
jgi:hypothetical protein